jgi:hypothetical protein
MLWGWIPLRRGSPSWRRPVGSAWVCQTRPALMASLACVSPPHRFVTRSIGRAGKIRERALREIERRARMAAWHRTWRDSARGALRRFRRGRLRPDHRRGSADVAPPDRYRATHAGATDRELRVIHVGSCALDFLGGGSGDPVTGRGSVRSGTGADPRCHSSCDGGGLSHGGGGGCRLLPGPSVFGSTPRLSGSRCHLLIERARHVSPGITGGSYSPPMSFIAALCADEAHWRSRKRS